MSDILQTILAAKRAEVAQLQRAEPLSALRRRAEQMPSTRDFIASLRACIASSRAPVIAEIKKASPSQGVLRADFDVRAIAQSYEAAGAACLSVLTDRQFFQGAPEYLQAARTACTLPVLRKDFIIDIYQIYEARALGADCVLLIAAALSLAQMQEFAAAARGLGMAVLTESHNAAELERALQVGTPLLGINNRNLGDFSVSLQTTLDLLPQIAPPGIAVSESGIRTPSDVARLRSAGVGAFLVGEAFMRSPQPGVALQALFAAA